MNNNDIKWFDGSITKSQPQIRFNQKGAISFSDTARKILPEYVSFGFLPSSKQLFLREGKEKQGFHVSSTPKAYPALTVYMSQQNVSFPAVYCIQEIEDASDQWVCTIINNTDAYLTKEIQKLAEVDAFSARTSDFMETLLSLYKPEIRKICRVTAKTIPKDNRFQLAQEGFIEAALNYNPNLHVFPDFALLHTKKYLESQIGKYSGSYTEFYALEKTAPDGDLYDTNSDPLALESFDLVINDNSLRQSLTPQEYAVYQKIAEGYKKQEIMDMYRVSSEEYLNILDAIRISLLSESQ